MYTVTDTPTNVRSVIIGQNTVWLSWCPPASNTPPVAGYEVFYAENGSNATQSGGTTIDITISVALPTPDVFYDFFVVAFSNEPNSLPSTQSVIHTICLNTSKYNFQHLSAMICIIHISFTKVSLDGIIYKLTLLACKKEKQENDSILANK